MPPSSATSDTVSSVPTRVVLPGSPARDRGQERGRRFAVQVARTCADYASLFAASGISADEAREAGLECHAAIRAVFPEVAEEIEGIAEGARIDLWHLSIVIARTEILSLSEGVLAGGEGVCATLVWACAGQALGAQTWDWHEDFRSRWHVQEVGPTPGGLGHAGLTEFGMPAKIGLNSARVGCFLNLLSHADDAPGAVPIHAILPAILGGAHSRHEALDMIAAARPRASSAISLVDASGALMVEVSPAGHTSHEVDGFAVHTNHFRDDPHAEGARRVGEERVSEAREGALRTRIETQATPPRTEDLLELLRDEGARTAASTQPARLPFGMRLATLATATIDPSRGQVSVGVGAPGDFAAGQMARLAPPAA